MILKNNYRALLFTFLSGVCLAQPAIANQTVDSPSIDKGAAYAEWKGGYDFDDDNDVDGSWVQEANFGYGVTNWMNLEIGGAVTHDGASGGNTDYEATNVEARFEFAKPGVLPIDLGLAVGYGLTETDDADGIEVKLLAQKEFGQFFNVANIIFDREIGDDAEGKTHYGLAYAAGYNFNENIAAGIEWYSDFGSFSESFNDEEHQIGPVIYGEAGSISYEFGVLAGVSDAAPDAELKAVIGYDFEF